MRGASEKQIPADDTVYILAQLETMRTAQTTDFWKYHSSKKKNKIKKSLFKCHTGACGIKGKKMHVLYTNHMYPSVVSNVKVKRKHPSWCLYIKHIKYISKPFHTPLICLVCTMSSPVTDGVYGYIHIWTECLIKWM